MPTPSRRSRKPAIFSIRNRQGLHDHVYSAGGSREPEELYKAFRGRLPTPEALLRRRGFADASVTM
jgi:peptidyl-dipeptidase Dcp